MISKYSPYTSSTIRQSGLSDVRVDNISGLSEYATSVNHFSATFSAGTEGVYRTFNAKTEGNEGDAVSAFLLKLNQLQEQVFVTLPSILNTHAQTVATYVGTLSELGFTTEAWSGEGGANLVSKHLTQEQYSEIVDTLDTVQKLFDQAADAMGTTAISLTREKSTSETALADLGKARTDLDTKVREAQKTFKDSLNKDYEALTGIQNALTSLSYMTSIPIDTVLSSIKDGTLSASDMYYFDNIRTETDKKMIITLLKEKEFKNTDEFFTALADIDSREMSMTGIDILHARLLEEVPEYTTNMGPSSSVSMTNLETFYNAIFNHDRDYVNDYMVNLSDASERLAKLLASQAQGLLPDFPKSGSMKREDYVSYQEELVKNKPALIYLNNVIKRVGILKSLSDLAYIEEMGVTSTEGNAFDGSGNFQTTDHFFMAKGSLVLASDGTVTYGKASTQVTIRSGTIESEKMVDGRENKDKVSSQLLSTAHQVDNAQLHEKKKQLESKLDTLAQNYLLNMAKDIVIDKVSMVNPVIGTGASIVDSLIQSDQQTSDVFGALSKTSDVAKAKNSSRFFDVLSRITGYYEDVDRINREIETVDSKIKANWFDIGGTKVESSKGTSATYDVTFDLQSQLQIKDFEDNGIRGYIFRSGENVEDGIEKIMAYNKEAKKSPDNGLYQVIQGTSDDTINTIDFEAVEDILDNYTLDFFDYESFDGGYVEQFEKLLGG